jgi:GntR family transcriptional repressor for pyruvate dehydrogenase complex
MPRPLMSDRLRKASTVPQLIAKVLSDLKDRKFVINLSDNLSSFHPASGRSGRLAFAARDGAQMAVRSPTLSKKISATLIRRIVRGEVQPGEAMPSEEDLAAQFDVSRPVIREAVKELAVIGLVESRQGRSTRVAAESEWNQFDARVLEARSEGGAVDGVLLQLLELRRIVETGAAGLAASRRSAADLDKMEAVIKEMEDSLSDPEQFTEADIRFHDALLRASGNTLLVRLIELIGPLLRVGRRMSLERRPDGPAESLKGHKQVLRAVKAADVDKARLAMHEHLSWTADLKLDDDEDAAESVGGQPA